MKAVLNYLGTSLLVILLFTKVAFAQINNRCESLFFSNILTYNGITVQGRESFSLFPPLPKRGLKYKTKFITFITPSDGIGKLMVFDTFETFGPGHAIISDPKYNNFFAQFDMYSNSTRFIMPDTVRLNAILASKDGADSVQFFDLPYYRWQRYGERYFFNILVTKRRI